MSLQEETQKILAEAQAMGSPLITPTSQATYRVVCSEAPGVLTRVLSIWLAVYWVTGKHPAKFRACCCFHAN